MCVRAMHMETACKLWLGLNIHDGNNYFQDGHNFYYTNCFLNTNLAILWISMIQFHRCFPTLMPVSNYTQHMYVICCAVASRVTSSGQCNAYVVLRCRLSSSYWRAAWSQRGRFWTRWRRANIYAWTPSTAATRDALTIQERTPESRASKCAKTHSFAVTPDASTFRTYRGKMSTRTTNFSLKKVA